MQDKIEFLEDELLKFRADTIPFTAVKNEMSVQYPNVANMAYGKTVVTNFKTRQDTNPVFYIKWKLGIEEEVISAEKAAISKWLKVRLNNKKVKVINY